MVSDLSPHDMCEDDTNERLGKGSSALERRLRRLQEEVKARKFRYKPELLDEKLLSSMVTCGDVHCVDPDCFNFVFEIFCVDPGFSK